MKKYVVVAVSEEGSISVYGPYKRKRAKKIASRIMDDDTSQKDRADVEKLSSYKGSESLTDDE